MNAKWIVCCLAIFGAAVVTTALSPATTQAMYGGVEKSPKRKDKVVLTDKEWRKKLTPAQYKILRGKGTEAAFCGLFNDHEEKGTYYCAGCDLPVFRFDAKFHSGSGWPSFFKPVSEDNIWTRTDRSFGMVRLEVLCARCDSHLGHVFEDAPQTPTGRRFCINSDALVFRKLKDGE